MLKLEDTKIFLQFHAQNFGLFRHMDLISEHSRVKSSKFGHQVNSDTHLQTVGIQMRRLLMSRLIRIFTVCLVNLFLFQ